MGHRSLNQGAIFLALSASLTATATAQTPAQAPPPDDTPPPPHGQVIIQSHGEPPPAPDEPGYNAPAPIPAEPVQSGNDDAKADVSDTERTALLITSYDLDARVNPAQSALSMRAQLTVRNSGTTPLRQLALQISSTLHWESATLVNGPARTHLALAQHRLDTDADHTGAEAEALLPLPEPLAPGATASLDLFYSGTLAESAGRLQRLGANAAQQQSTDWDAISTAWIGLRGFGNVLWYPVASPQLFLGDGNNLFAAVGATRLREQAAFMRMRLSVSYTGGAPVAAYFCGRRQDLKITADDPDATVFTGSGVAQAEFPAELLGFRTPSLFVLDLPESFPAQAAPAASLGQGSGPAPDPSSSSSSSSDSSAAPDAPSPAPFSAGKQSAAVVADVSHSPFVAVETTDEGAALSFGAAADRVAPLLREWLGPSPLSALTVIDHRGQPYQDGPLLVGPMAVLGTSPEYTALLQSLTHAWVQTGQPWMDEGLAQFFALLWTERQDGRTSANAALDELLRPVGLVEPDFSGAIVAGKPKVGQPLVAAQDDLFYRRKAAAVWWMLRALVGDGNLHQALSAWRVQPISTASPTDQAIAFERLLEKLSGKDLAWFFADWVLHDRGLPDLTITDVAAIQGSSDAGKAGGWLVAVTVRNEGGAAADVPVVIHSGNARPTEARMRVAGLSSATQRIRVENQPTAIDVNDGSVPELQTSTHTAPIDVTPR